MLTELDQALEALWDDPENPGAQIAFYDLFLNTSFFVPTTAAESTSGGCAGTGSTAPLIVDFEGEEYLVLFDRLERLTGWAEKALPHAEVPGHVLAKMSVPNLFWALNVGTEHAKQFVPEEITWLASIVADADQDSDSASSKGNLVDADNE